MLSSRSSMVSLSLRVMTVNPGWPTVKLTSYVPARPSRASATYAMSANSAGEVVASREYASLTKFDVQIEDVPRDGGSGVYGGVFVRDDAAFEGQQLAVVDAIVLEPIARLDEEDVRDADDGRFVHPGTEHAKVRGDNAAGTTRTGNGPRAPFVERADRRPVHVESQMVQPRVPPRRRAERCR